MAYYGHTKKITLTKDVLSCILNCLPEEYWYLLKWNHKILALMSALHKKDTVKKLAKNGHVESLAGRDVRLKYICESNSLTLVKRWILVEKPIGTVAYGALVNVATWKLLI